ncbi:MAG: type II secretion system protein GspE [Candidatus Rokuibacteriota bacterium]|nr:MAG: type II secretion system protein GspE [Candidatus Rokubacteria bacterium]
MALITGTRLLGEILVADGVTTPDMITAALDRMQTSGERIGEALVALGAVTKDDVLKALAAQNNLPYLFRGELPSPLPVVKNLSPKYLRQYVVCPIAVEGGLLTVATADPLNPMIVDDLHQSTGLDVRIVVSPGEGILEAIDRTYDGAATPLQRIVEGLEDDRGPEGEEDVNHLRDMAFEAPVIRLVNLLVENAIAAEASDIHIEPFEDTLRVRYRIDGILFDQESPPRRLRDAVTSRIKLMSEMNIAERRLPQDGRIRVSLQNRRVDIRVSTIPTVHGESIVMRLLDRASVFLPLEKLGFSPDTLKHFEALIQRPHGILLVTGPTGSGKTTTLYAALEKINSPDRKIVTIEDPVEYQLKGVNQIPVKPKIGLSFSTGLRHIVRQDPDVILVGEIRDLETVEIAIQAALTGHMVFSTLHTNDAPGAIPRLQDMGAEPYLVASVLEGVLAQRLVRRTCAACRVPETPSAADIEALGIDAPPGVPLYRGRGCDECRGTGYRGRTAIYELFAINEDIRSLILKRASSREIRRLAIEAGMTTLRMDGWARACEGVTTVEEVLRVTQEDA